MLKATGTGLRVLMARGNIAPAKVAEVAVASSMPQSAFLLIRFALAAYSEPKVRPATSDGTDLPAMTSVSEPRLELEEHTKHQPTLDIAYDTPNACQNGQASSRVSGAAYFGHCYCPIVRYRERAEVFRALAIENKPGVLEMGTRVEGSENWRLRPSATSQYRNSPPH